MAFKDEFGLLRSSFISCSQLLFAWFTWTFSSEENEVWGKFLQTDLEVGFFEIKFFFFCNKGKWSFLEKKKIICLPLLIFLMARINSPNIYLKKLQFCLLFFLFRVIFFNRLLYLPWIMGLEKISLFQTNDWITVSSNDFFNFASYISDHWLLP